MGDAVEGVRCTLFMTSLQAFPLKPSVWITDWPRVSKAFPYRSPRLFFCLHGHPDSADFCSNGIFWDTEIFFYSFIRPVLNPISICQRHQIQIMSSPLHRSSLLNEQGVFTYRAWIRVSSQRESGPFERWRLDLRLESTVGYHQLLRKAL